MEYGESGYGKRPMWQWIALYLFIGALAYYAVYYFILKPNGGYLTPTAYSPTTTTPVPTETNKETVSYSNSGFEPKNLNIKVGATVIWVNQGDESVEVASSPHPAHTDYLPLNLESLEPGKSVSLTFPKSGTYKYHNHLNYTHYGTITVE